MTYPYKHGHRLSNTERQKMYRDKNSLKRRLTLYKRGAKTRGREWNISDEEAAELFEQPCYYCGGEGGGIDRLDNKQGYVKGNLVPCCIVCNYMKGRFDFEDFLYKVVKIAVHRIYPMLEEEEVAT